MNYCPGCATPIDPDDTDCGDCDLDYCPICNEVLTNLEHGFYCEECQWTGTIEEKDKLTFNHNINLGEENHGNITS